MEVYYITSYLSLTVIGPHIIALVTGPLSPLAPQVAVDIK